MRRKSWTTAIDILTTAALFDLALKYLCIKVPCHRIPTTPNYAAQPWLIFIIIDETHSSST